LIFRADGTEVTRISQNDDHIIAVIRNSERIGVVLRRDDTQRVLFLDPDDFTILSEEDINPAPD
ncbi:MAG: hypothetical protein AAGI70_10600, partial [Pseudomonadota bacterium]